jgi:nucleoside-triphosphatase THEP1
MITIVTGGTNTYKTTYVENFVEGMENADGILSKKRFLGERFDGYFVEHIGSGVSNGFLSLSVPSGDRVGEFYVQKKGLEFAKSMIRKAIEENKVVVIDELGLAELSGRLFYDELKLLISKDADAVLVIRKRLLCRYLEKFPQLTGATIVEVTMSEKQDGKLD